MTDQKIPAPEPVALMLQHRAGRKTLHPYAEHASAYRDTAIGQYLLITLESAETYAAAREAAARMEEQARIVEIMRHVDRLCRHMDEWQRWYGRNDVLMRNQLPLPPSRTAQIMEDLDAAIRAG
jgi:hypothetical protein